MDKKFVIPGVLLWDTEAFHVITATDADFTVNSKRVLNSSDLFTPVNELVELQNTLDYLMSVVPTAVSFAGPITPPSVDGISLLNPTTIRVTKKGSYQFKLQTNTDVGGKTLVILKKNGVNFDGNSFVAQQVGADLNIAHFALFDFNQTTDTTVDFQFFQSGDTYPVTGNPIRGLVDLTISHINIHP
jgi:hypothetical protein